MWFYEWLAKHTIALPKLKSDSITKDLVKILTLCKILNPVDFSL
jgi:hypothetical protein